eukprot:TRINITY_DN4049_c0_g1_i4.p1 TRINITY_DN4049_c0_g1~~TRINITY_DN4049_c0_g1_i4.p1  ORF type:complete len:811 (+),score=137.04 TRINITY_DN4049_c0_g1_i4:333-2435(+)
MDVKPIVSHHCLSVGDVLRLVDEKKLVSSDFVLVSADVVSNMNLARAIEVHKERRNANKAAIMTIVMGHARHAQHVRRLGDYDQLVALDSQTKQLIQYSLLDSRSGPQSFQNFKLDASVFSERDVVEVRSDLLDVGIYICAPEVLVIYSDNFDYQNIRKDFIQGVLSEEELGNKLYSYPLQKEYAARVHNLRSYDAISRDIISRWAYPYVPDTNIFAKKIDVTTNSSGSEENGECNYRLHRGNVYREVNSFVEKLAIIERGSVIGVGSVLRSGCQVYESVIGNNCIIGHGVIVRNCYLMDNVQVNEGAVLNNSILCDNVVILQGVTVNSNCILSYNVVIAAGHEVPTGSLISLYQQSGLQSQSYSDDEEQEYTPRSARGDGLEEQEELDQKVLQIATKLGKGEAVEKQDLEASFFSVEVVGHGGAGYSWDVAGNRIAEEVAIQQIKISEQQIQSYLQRLQNPAISGQLVQSEDDVGVNKILDGRKLQISETMTHPDQRFRKEVAETFLRCVQQRFSLDNAQIELNGLRLAENRSFADCARFMFTSICELCCPVPEWVPQGYTRLYPKEMPDAKQMLIRFQQYLDEQKKLLLKFVRQDDDQIELLLTFEEFCGQEEIFENNKAGEAFSTYFTNVLKILYDMEIVEEDAILLWAQEKAEAEEEELRFLKMAQPFIDWLQTATEEEDSDEEEDEDDDEEEEEN